MHQDFIKMKGYILELHLPIRLSAAKILNFLLWFFAQIIGLVGGYFSFLLFASFYIKSNHRIMKNSKQNYPIYLAYSWLILLGLSPLNGMKLSAQEVPTADYLGRWLSKTTSVVSEVSQTITVIAEPLVNTFEKAQDFLVKAETVVNGVIKNMRAVQDIIELQQAIFDYYQKSIEVINEARDWDLDGEDDLVWLDKWKHLQILLALFKESTDVLSLFDNLLAEGAFTMDDHNRVQFLFQTRADLRKIKTAMRIEIRRINQEIYAFGALQREQKTFEKLFE